MGMTLSGRIAALGGSASVLSARHAYLTAAFLLACTVALWLWRGDLKTQIASDNYVAFHAQGSSLDRGPAIAWPPKPLKAEDRQVTPEKSMRGIGGENFNGTSHPFLRSEGRHRASCPRRPRFTGVCRPHSPC